MIKKISMFAVALFAFYIMASAQQQEATGPKPIPFDTIFKAEKKWLVLPVKNGAPKRKVEIWLDGSVQRYIDIELAEDNPDWLSYLDISQWQGRDLDLRVNLRKPGSKTFSPVIQADDDKNNADLYKEKYRGRFHFSSKRGWNNDPNGMAYYNGEYHLFWQHNPYGREWGNMTWGHAVSKDLVKWEEVGEAIHPDVSGTMYSGSGIVDSNNTSGYGKDGKAPLVLFYTSDKSWTQGTAFSLDGRTFTKPVNAVVPRFTMGNRDPKVIWHAPTKKWVMVHWSESKQNSKLQTMMFYTSDNLKYWTYASTFEGKLGNFGYLFECPEFYEIAVEGEPSTKKWVLTGANSAYAIGTFDGKTFKAEAENLQAQNGRDFYAAQTFNNEPKGRRVEIGWWRTKTAIEDMTFNMSMSIPLEIKLVKTDSGLRITRTPVAELGALRKGNYKQTNLSLKQDKPVSLSKTDVQEFEMMMELTPSKASVVQFDIHGKSFSYDTGSQEIICDGVKAKFPLIKGKLALRVFVDRVGFEIFSADGLQFMPVNINLNMENKAVTATAKSGSAKINKIEVYPLGSIWE